MAWWNALPCCTLVLMLAGVLLSIVGLTGVWLNVSLGQTMFGGVLGTASAELSLWHITTGVSVFTVALHQKEISIDSVNGFSTESQNLLEKVRSEYFCCQTCVGPQRPKSHALSVRSVRAMGVVL